MFNTEQNSNDLSNQESIVSEFDIIKKLLNEEKHEEAKKRLIDLHQADLADLVDNCSNDQIYTIFSLIDKDFNSETLILLNPKSKAIAAEIFGINLLASYVSELTAEDAIDFITDLNDEIKNQILELLPEEKRLHILEGFNYPEYSAGRVMAKKFIAFKQDWTAGQAIDSIRSDEEAPDNFHSVVVVNSKNKPVGTVSLSALLKLRKSDPIKDIMNDDLRMAGTHTGLEDISYIFKHYALSVVPVVNKTGKIMGTISIDNMVSIIEEQAEDAVLHMGGVYEADIYETFITAAKQRFPWLFINLIAACLTAVVVNHFGPTIAKIVALASLMPIVSSMGGNAGMQTMTVTLMAITNKDVNRMNNAKIVLKELLSCGMNGIVFAFLGAAIVIALFNDFMLAQVFGIAIIINFLIGGVFGSSIPLILNWLKMDPALSSVVILNALTDSCGFLILLGLASIILIP